MNEQIKFYESKLDFEMDASDLFHALNEGEKIVVIDARQRHGFDNEHIPNAVNLPHREMNKESTKDFDRNFVCNLLRWDRLQCLDKRSVENDNTRFQGQRIVGRNRMVEIRRLRNRRQKRPQRSGN
jgi:hypothetical protein